MVNMKSPRNLAILLLGLFLVCVETKKPVNQTVKNVKKTRVSPFDLVKDVVQNIETQLHIHPREKKGSATKANATQVKDPYDTVKKAEGKTKTSPNPKEHNKWGGLIRGSIRFIIELTSVFLTPVKDITSTVGKAAKKVLPIPDTKGLDTNSTFGGVLEDFKEKISGLHPGTKWCGAGNIADSHSDLGIFNASDSCCRTHDHCPLNMAAGETKYGLKNNGLFTRSACSCDKAFYNCLKKANTAIAEEIGYTYFTILGPQCFKLVHCNLPNVTCRNGKTRGVEYQWSDNPKY